MAEAHRCVGEDEMQISPFGYLPVKDPCTFQTPAVAFQPGNVFPAARTIDRRPEHPLAQTDFITVENRRDNRIKIVADKRIQPQGVPQIPAALAAEVLIVAQSVGGDAVIFPENFRDPLRAFFRFPDQRIEMGDMGHGVLQIPELSLEQPIQPRLKRRFATAAFDQFGEAGQRIQTPDRRRSLVAGEMVVRIAAEIPRVEIPDEIPGLDGR